MKGSTMTVALVMVRRIADWLRSRHCHTSLGINAAMGNTALEERTCARFVGRRGQPSACTSSAR
jgi:hypothetical protein